MELQDILLRFFQVVAKDLRHKHYNHTVKKHVEYMALVAGVGTDKLLKRYVRREDELLFKQRVALTNHIVTAVCKNLLDPFYKVPRSNSGRRILTYTGNAREEWLTDVEGMLNTFWGDESWDDYMATRFVELNSVDPNAFVAFEFKAFDAQTELVKPYPYEVSSAMAVDYKKVNKVLEYLVARDDHTYSIESDKVNGDIGGSELPDPARSTKAGHKFTLYTKNQTFQLRQVAETTASGLASLIEGKVVDKRTEDGNKRYVKLGQNYYEFEEYLAHDCDQLPVVQVGYYRDLATHGATFVSPIHPAVPYLLKTVKTNSELDLVATLLAFPQLLMYGEQCTDEDCYKGYHNTTGAVCGTCKGTGIRASAPSAQDAIVLALPKDKEQLVPLKDVMTYLSPPVDIVKWQEEYVESLTVKCRSTMFNGDYFDRKKVAETAQGKNLDAQNVYDTLYPFAIKFGKTWTAGTQIMAKLADRIENLVATYTFGKDFKLKTLDTLIADLSEVNDNGNSPTLVRHLNHDIATIIFSDKPLEMQRYRLQELHNPFQGKSEKEIALLLVSNLVSRADKVLHANYGRIFDELEIDYAEAGKGDFYQLKRLPQRKAIYEKVAEIIATIDNENPAPELDLGA